jgi:hypothetical protein
MIRHLPHIRAVQLLNQRVQFLTPAAIQRNIVHNRLDVREDFLFKFGAQGNFGCEVIFCAGKAAVGTGTHHQWQWRPARRDAVKVGLLPHVIGAGQNGDFNFLRTHRTGDLIFDERCHFTPRLNDYH